MVGDTSPQKGGDQGLIQSYESDKPETADVLWKPVVHSSAGFWTGQEKAWRTVFNELLDKQKPITNIKKKLNNVE